MEKEVILATAFAVIFGVLFLLMIYRLVKTAKEIA